MQLQGIFSQLQQAGSLATRAGGQMGTYLRTHAVSSSLFGLAATTALYRGYLGQKWTTANERLGTGNDDSTIDGVKQDGSIHKAYAALVAIQAGVAGLVNAGNDANTGKIQDRKTWTEVAALLSDGEWNKLPTQHSKHIKEVLAARSQALTDIEGKGPDAKVAEARELLVDAMGKISDKIGESKSVTAIGAKAMVDALKADFARGKTIADVEAAEGMLNGIARGQIAGAINAPFNALLTAVLADTELKFNEFLQDAEGMQKTVGEIGQVIADARAADNAKDADVLKALSVELPKATGPTSPFHALANNAVVAQAQSEGWTGKVVFAAFATLLAAGLVVRFANEVPALQRAITKLPTNVRPFIA